MIKKDYLNQNSVYIMYLILTKRCNFSCKQCFQPERHPNLVDKMPDVVYWAAKEMGVRCVEFNPIGGKSFDFTESGFSREQYDVLLADGLVEAYKTARELGIYEGRVGKKIEDFVLRSFRTVDCGAFGG